MLEGRHSGHLLIVSEVAQEVGVTEETVRRWLRRKELRGILLGRKVGYRVRTNDLQAFLEARANWNAPPEIG